MTDLIRTIIRKCGGPNVISEATATSHKPITRNAIDKWVRSGGTIPEVHWDTLMQIAAVRDESLDIDDLYQANQAARREAARLDREVREDLDTVSHGGHPSEPRAGAQGGV